MYNEEKYFYEMLTSGTWQNVSNQIWHRSCSFDTDYAVILIIVYSYKIKWYNFEHRTILNEIRFESNFESLIFFFLVTFNTKFSSFTKRRLSYLNLENQILFCLKLNNVGNCTTLSYRLCTNVQRSN